MAETISLEKHQRSLCTLSDQAKAQAQGLRRLLWDNPNLPLPEEETNELVRVLAVFVAAAESYPR